MKNYLSFNRTLRIFRFFIFVLSISIFYSGKSSQAADFFVSSGGSGITCSQSVPCDLQYAITNAGDGDTIYVKGGETYYGTAGNDNVIEIADSINLLGGWDGTTSVPVVRDPDTYVTTLDGGETRRVIHISGSGETPTIDGFTITNGDATGLTTDCLGSGTDTPDGCGGGIFVYQADPVISNNIISNNYAATASPSGGYVGYGGGMYLRSSNNAEISRNEFYSNTGSSITYGRGGAIYSTACGSGVSIHDNNFMSNYACTGTGYGHGAALYLLGGDINIQGNNMENNQSSTSGFNGTCITAWSCSPTIKNNSIVNNIGDGSVDVTVRLGYFSGTFESNCVLNNSMSQALILTGQTASNVTIVNNIIEGIESHSILLTSTSGETITATLTHNTITGNGAGYGIDIRDYCAVTMWNNIVANHSTKGVNVNASSSLNQANTLFWNNLDNGVTGTNPVYDDPAFKNPSGSNYHIKGNSAAIDAGAVIAITEDIDGDSRPNGSGYDIGADEFYGNTLSGIIMMLLN